MLLAYSYPGNVRELQNIIERAVALAETDTLTLADLPPDLRIRRLPNGRWSTLEETEREHIRSVLAFTNHHSPRAPAFWGCPAPLSGAS